MPGLLVGMVDGRSSGCLERRVLRLLEARVPWARRWRAVSAVGCVMAAAVVCVGAVGFGVKVEAAEQKKEFRFEVVSIHMQNPALPAGAGFSLDLSPGGYRSALTLWQMLMIAYAPGDNNSWNSMQIVNTPELLKDPTWYIIDARVAAADQKAWSSQSNKHELLRLAMQNGAEGAPCWCCISSRTLNSGLQAGGGEEGAEDEGERSGSGAAEGGSDVERGRDGLRGTNAVALLWSDDRRYC